MELTASVNITSQTRTLAAPEAAATVRAIAPGTVISTEELGRAMIRAARQGAPKQVLETRDLRALGVP
jgi:hypothetical protein